VLATVPTPEKRLDDYIEVAGEAAIERLREAAEPLAGARVLHLNTTNFGGGVAELLFTHVPLMRDLGIDATWAVIEGSDDYFAVTKAIHNALQGAPIDWTPQMVATYWERIIVNAADIPGDFDYYLIHDPQPAGVIRVLEEEDRRHGQWLWRCHIDLSTPDPAVWEFFEPIVNHFEAAIFTMEEFAQPGVRKPELAYIAPSIDPLSVKNRPVSGETTVEVMAAYGIDVERPIITQVSRFDPWKDPIGVIDAFRLVREEVPGVQLIMAGSLAHDDPEGLQYLDLTEEHRAGDTDICLLTDLHGVGDLQVSSFQQASDVIVQKSKREGFGLVVAEGMWKEKPIVGGNVGGIRLQIGEGETGHLVDSVESCATRIVELLRDPDRRRQMGAAGRERVRENFLSLREVEDYLRLMTRVT
jgi:trehalose synthase